MCGITGIFSFNLVGKFNKVNVTAATMSLQRRGPDFQDIYIDEWVGLGHRRLSIIDTSPAGNQPMWDESRRYCIVFNGEIFNYRELKKQLIDKGITFFSESDSEVLLKLFIADGEECLNKLNGFFSFCIYDKQLQTFFLARDRYGIKPLLYVFDEDKFIFASEMKTIVAYGIDKQFDYPSLLTYLQLNYIPAPDTIFTNVKKLLPGHSIKVSAKKIQVERWYQIPYSRSTAAANDISYPDAQKQLKSLLEASVQRRLVSDVPLGAFLSGGIDSSIITGLAARHKTDLHTFSIGFRDEKFFDETHYARLVAKHFKTEHTVFSLSNDDLFAHVNNILDYIDEPFADSSAINVFILSKETRKHATVALSGDGADEMFGGYNKHEAFLRMGHPGWKEYMIKNLKPIVRALPQSRNNSFGNRMRQMVRFADAFEMSPKERYWKLAGFASKHDALNLLHESVRAQLQSDVFESRKTHILRHIQDDYTMNEVFLTDMELVLQNDMLTKVDLMSMANGLEVRVPFLDFELVNFAFSLPSEFKINQSLRKRIVQDAFRDFLPKELYNRPKKGFEVPLLKWFRREMKSLIMDDLLSRDRIEGQGIFDYASVDRLKKQLMSGNPGDVHARIWGLVVFQWWTGRVLGKKG